MNQSPSVIDIPLHQDDRGWVYCLMDGVQDFAIKRTYVVENLRQGQIRAYHGHKIAGTYMHVINGSCKLAAVNMNNSLNSNSIEDYVVATLSDRVPQLFYVPPGYYNGALSLTEGTKILVLSTLSFKEVKDDNYRRPADEWPHILKVVDR